MLQSADGPQTTQWASTPPTANGQGNKAKLCRLPHSSNGSLLNNPEKNAAFHCHAQSVASVKIFDHLILYSYFYAEGTLP
jgi:hypothetical protein